MTLASSKERIKYGDEFCRFNSCCEGLSYIKGLDDFGYYMPKSKCHSLWLAGFSVEKVVLWARRLARIHNTPPCVGRKISKECKWLKRPDKEEGFYTTARPTAFRVELIAPSNRCGYLLKKGRMGGRWWDYRTCNRLCLTY